MLAGSQTSVEPMFNRIAKLDFSLLRTVMVLVAVLGCLFVSISTSHAAECDGEDEIVEADACDDDCDAPCQQDDDGDCDCSMVCNACGCSPSVMSVASFSLHDIAIDGGAVRGDLPVTYVAARRGVSSSVFKPPRYLFAK